MINKNYLEAKKECKENGLILMISEDEFQGYRYKYPVKCSKGHVWSPRLDDIFSSHKINRISKGCPKCAEQNYLKQSLDNAQLHLLPNHTIISSYLKPIGSQQVNERRYKAECEYGHIYEKRSSKLSEGCPECSKKTFVGQERVRLIFQENFQQLFPTVRPDWLKNPDTNQNLELDGYCEELKLAFEYQGRQHMSNDTQFGGDYTKQQVRDEYKKQACTQHGITLIIINQPRSYNVEKFFMSVAKDCEQQGFSLTIDGSTINFNTINDTNSIKQNYSVFQNFVITKGYKLLTDSYSTMEDLLQFQCQHMHNFNMKGSTFKTMLNTDKYRNEPCPTCHQLDSPKKVAEKITIESCTDLAKKIGYKCLSTQYVNINELLEWQCNHGHTLAKSYRQMVRNQTGNYCATCSELHLEQAPSIYKTVVIEELKASKVSRSSNGEVRDYNWLNEFATDHKLVLLENHYLGMDVKHDFKCIKGHEFNSTVTNLMEKKERGTSLCNHVECNGVNVINLETCREFAKSNSLECLSIEYKNVNEKMKWKCSHNHEFEKTYRQFLRSKTKNYCPDCA